MIYGRDADLPDRSDRLHRRRSARRARARRTRRDRARPQQREGARASRSAARQPGDREPGRARVVRAAADAQDGYVHAAYRRAIGPRAVDRADRARGDHRGREAAAHRRFHGAAQALHHLHVRQLDPRRRAGAGPPKRPRSTRSRWASFRPAHEKLVLDAAGDHLRTRPDAAGGGRLRNGEALPSAPRSGRS